MELQFEKHAWPCLMTAVANIKNEEQTQEVRLGDNMPDIGKVIGAWGQVLLRGKEWRGNGMAISTGIMTWVLYAPEDGSEPRLVETWIPVQMKWDFPETKHDGSILVNCQLAAIDARSVSARKLMIRAVVSAFGEAVVSDLVDVWKPGNMPEDVYLLKKTYPIRLPREAGEKGFSLDEEFDVPTQTQKIICYTLRPEIADTNVVAGKVVFRGNVRLHLLLQDVDGNLSASDQEFSFSQFADLDHSYDTDPTVRVVPAVTNLELDLLPTNRIHMKAGLLGQYVISDQPILEVIEDAYSNRRSVEIHSEQLMLPAELDRTVQTMRLTVEEPLAGERILDAVLLCGHSFMKREDKGVTLTQNGAIQLLYQTEGDVKGTTVHANEDIQIYAHEDAVIHTSTLPVGKLQYTFTNGHLIIGADTEITVASASACGIPMVTGLSLGEYTLPDSERPSMILRRCNGQGLWDIAKNSGSTVDEITKINQLNGEPDSMQMLLIPVL